MLDIDRVKYNKSVKLLWSSQLKNKQGVPYISVKEATTPKGGKYIFASRAGRDSVKFMLVDYNKKLFGLVSEIKPPLVDRYAEEFDVSVFGGSIDEDILMSDICFRNLVVQEVKEEAGFIVDIGRVKHIKTGLLSSQSDELVLCYLVDVTNIYPDNTKMRALEFGEEFSSVVWVTRDDLIRTGCLISMALASTITDF